MSNKRNRINKRDKLRQQMRDAGFTVKFMRDDYDVFRSGDQNIFVQYNLKSALFVKDEGMKHYIMKLDYRKDLYHQISIGLVKFRLGVQDDRP